MWEGKQRILSHRYFVGYFVWICFFSFLFLRLFISTRKGTKVRKCAKKNKKEKKMLEKEKVRLLGLHSLFFFLPFSNIGLVVRTPSLRRELFSSSSSRCASLFIPPYSFQSHSCSALLLRLRSVNGRKQQRGCTASHFFFLLLTSPDIQFQKERKKLISRWCSEIEKNDRRRLCDSVNVLALKFEFFSLDSRCQFESLIISSRRCAPAEFNGVVTTY